MMMWIPLLLLAVSSTSMVAAQQGFAPFRLNCGGPRYVDPNSQFVWNADSKTYVTTGSTANKCGSQTVAFANTTASMRNIYCSNRFFKPTTDPLKSYQYTIPVLNTTEATNAYMVRLHFAEMEYTVRNARKMDVLINGVLHLNDFDIVANSGVRTAFVYQTPNPIIASKGVIQIRFIPVYRNAIISGIEVLSAPTTTKSPTSVPTKRPTSFPTQVPTTNSPMRKHPTSAPVTQVPTTTRTSSPTNVPVTKSPTETPTSNPTKTPITKSPTMMPTLTPTKNPTTTPTCSPTNAPVTKTPTNTPASNPTKAPVTTTPTKTPVTLSPFVYYRNNDTNTLGVPDVKVAIGNPLKGLAGGPRWSQQSPLPNSVPSAIEFYNIALDEVMIGDNQFNWTLHDRFLNESAGRKMHVVFSVYIDWPGRPLRLPPHLRDIPLYPTSGGGLSPNYGEPRLLTALQQFIVAWSDHIEGDTRVAALHVGLLGFWGEGHTYPDNALVPESSKSAVAQWYRDAFHTTQIQTRYPGPNAASFGLYDGSLAYSTLDGTANGGVNIGWFQYPRMVENSQTDIWKSRMMGGETRPELQGTIFTDMYPARTEYHQDYKECVDALHISYAVHHGAFHDGGYTGNTLRNANFIHAYMGYAFFVSEVAAITTSISSAHAVSVAVTITQLGVAPFYYDLNLMLQCENGLVQKLQPGVNEIIQKGDFRTFTFTGVPATSACLGKVTLSLDSSYAYSGRPILLAQGSDGKVEVNIPVPGTPIPFLRT